MSIGAILIGIALLVIAVPIVAAPLVRGTREKIATGDSQEPTLADRRKEILLALRDLEFDHRTGKVTQEDYAALHATLLARAAEMMEMEDELNAHIEAIVLAQRQKGVVEASEFRCSLCGARLTPDDTFCATCGAPARNPERCPECSQPVRGGARFCPACGTRLAVPSQVVL